MLYRHAKKMQFLVEVAVVLFKKYAAKEKKNNERKTEKEAWTACFSYYLIYYIVIIIIIIFKFTLSESIFFFLLSVFIIAFLLSFWLLRIISYVLYRPCVIWGMCIVLRYHETWTCSLRIYWHMVICKVLLYWAQCAWIGDFVWMENPLTIFSCSYPRQLCFKIFIFRAHRLPVCI